MVSLLLRSAHGTFDPEPAGCGRRIALRDHTANAAWLGGPAVLNLSVFGG